jgi:hypothetical protein
MYKKLYIMPYKYNNSHFTYTNTELKTRPFVKLKLVPALKEKKYKIHIGHGFFRGFKFGKVILW